MEYAVATNQFKLLSATSTTHSTCHGSASPACCLNEDASLSEMLSWGNCAVAEAWQAAVNVVAFWRSILRTALRCGSERGPVLSRLVTGCPCDAAPRGARRTMSARCRHDAFAGAARVRRLRLSRFEAKRAITTLSSGTSRVGRRALSA